MRSIDIEVGPKTETGIWEIDCSGVCLNSCALTFTGTATAKVESYLGNGTWVDHIASTSTNAVQESNYPVFKLRLNVTAYTSGGVHMGFSGLRGT